MSVTCRSCSSYHFPVPCQDPRGDGVTRGGSPWAPQAPQGGDTHVVQDVDAVGALRGLPVVHDVGDEVVGGVGVRGLHLLRQVLPQVHVPGDPLHPQGGHRPRGTPTAPTDTSKVLPSPSQTVPIPPRCPQSPSQIPTTPHTPTKLSQMPSSPPRCLETPLRYLQTPQTPCSPLRHLQSPFRWF